MTGIGSRIQQLFGLKKTIDPLSEIKNKPLNAVTYVVLDLETTGLDTNKDLILSFGGVKIQDGTIQVGESLEQLFKESESILNESVKIHGILNNHIEDGHETIEALKKIHSFIGDGVVVGHHVDFDFNMLKNAMLAHLDIELKNPRLDTATLAIRLEKGALATSISKGEYSLDALCKRYNIEAFDRHTAPGDAFLTAQLLIQFLKIAEEKGINTVSKLLEKRRNGLV